VIGSKKVLGVIIARGGSKGLPGKNVADLGGKPMIAWSVEAGKGSRYIDRLVLSSDDRAIIDAAKEYGCEVPFVRDPALADDFTGGTDVVIDAVKKLPGYDYVVLLQATSPLRSAEDVDGCLDRLIASGAPSCLSVTALEKPVEWLMRVNEHGRLDRLVEGEHTDRRQDAQVAFAPNGAVYAAKTDWLLETGTFYSEDTAAYEMPRERSVDIDTELDLAIAAAIIERARATA